MKGLIRSLSRNPAKQAVMKQTIRFANLALLVDGATGVGFNAAIAGDLPAGNLTILGAAAYVQFTKQASATGLLDAFDGDYAIGTTPTADATLSGTDANIIAIAAIGAATAGLSPVARGISGAPGAPLDNTDGALELNLNVIIDDASISGDDQSLYASGYVVISYVVLGDD